MDFERIHRQLQNRARSKKGDTPGQDGREIELQSDSTYIQWRYKGFETKWINLVAIKDLQGAKGDPGKQGLNGTPGSKGDPGIPGSAGLPGADGIPGTAGTPGIDGLDGKDGKNGKNGEPGEDGREIELRKSTTHVQWRYVGETLWKNLVLLSDLKGDPGEPGEKGNAGEPGERGAIGFTGASGSPGAPGAGVADGGTAGQILAKATNDDFDTEWVAPPGGGGSGTPGGNNTEIQFNAAGAFDGDPGFVYDPALGIALARSLRFQNDPAGGGHNIIVFSQTEPGIVGNSLLIQAGEGNDTGVGGSLTLEGGAGGANSPGGDVVVRGGNGGNMTGDGANVQIIAGYANAGGGAGGSLIFVSGDEEGAGLPGIIAFKNGLGGIVGILDFNSLTIEPKIFTFPDLSGILALLSDEAYSSDWADDTSVAPSKKAVYDKLETLSAGLSQSQVLARGLGA